MVVELIAADLKITHKHSNNWNLRQGNASRCEKTRWAQTKNCIVIKMYNIMYSMLHYDICKFQRIKVLHK